MLPFFMANFPDQAKCLLRYRYDRLSAAAAKAKAYGFDGAMFPWESAATGEEETPPYAAIDIETGKPTPIPNGAKEIHITADIAFMTMRYFQMTGDLDFMQRYGCEMILACALFWVSRCEKTERGYEIKGVIGPDEYTEDIDNNSYTNHMVRAVLGYALDCAAMLEHLPDRAAVEKRWAYEGKLPLFKEIGEKLYFPPSKDGIIPQDDSFLSKPSIDISAYQAAAGKQSILKDYTREAVIQMQVMKQADLAMLFFLNPEGWSVQERIQNLLYYENRTIHDSSLSKCVYGIGAMDLGLSDMADDFFRQSLEIDFGPNPSCRDGIHAAAAFGIWNLLVRGALGMHIGPKGLLRFHSALPGCIKSLGTNLYFQGRVLRAYAGPDGMEFALLSGDGMEIEWSAQSGEYQSVYLEREQIQ